MTEGAPATGTRLEIEHDTVFTYSQPVFIEPHTLRLRPRHEWRQQLLAYDLQIEPGPAGRADNVGLDDVVETDIWFDGLLSGLRLRSRSVVELPAPQPFSFLLRPDALSLPVTYTDAESRRLAVFLQRFAATPAVDACAAAAARTAGGEVLPTLTELARALWRDLGKEIRETGDPLSPAQTLAAGTGACRDLAELYVDACRSLGLAARFVSGYSESEVVDDERFLHAWAEVFLPGAGWRGFDPTLGIAVMDRHVAIASGPSHAEARPYDGTFRGTGATSQMVAHIRMRMSPSVPVSSLETRP